MPLLFALSFLFFTPAKLLAADSVTAQETEQVLEGMTLIPAGPFTAGPPDAPRTMHLDAFYIDTHEVTQREYETVTGRNPSFFKDPDRPVEKVDWFEARDYCKQIGRRLPTDWEWEKAAKAGTKTSYYWGDAPAADHAWYKDNANKQTHPVGQKTPNAFGLYDMAGNVWEWTASDHENGGKVQRGGSWRNGEETLQSAYRILSLPHYQYHYVGFRCADSVKPRR
ncbi:FGE-sulfatase domain-containing protein [Nitrospina watsonii]|uniref:FGE-sulfatase domain-containing protein n=1 Tax=Nitrospina watsonii TaxID=1323948 RepID=A0ABM9HB24_9BACT|nr:FGE-sulfatase domain-containing protein [Nitrospina watsonii]